MENLLPDILGVVTSFISIVLVIVFFSSWKYLDSQPGYVHNRPDPETDPPELRKIQHMKCSWCEADLIKNDFGKCKNCGGPN